MTNEERAISENAQLKYEGIARELWENMVEVWDVSKDGAASNVGDITTALRKAAEDEKESILGWMEVMGGADLVRAFHADEQRRKDRNK